MNNQGTLSDVTNCYIQWRKWVRMSHETPKIELCQGNALFWQMRLVIADAFYWKGARP